MSSSLLVRLGRWKRRKLNWTIRAYTKATNLKDRILKRLICRTIETWKLYPSINNEYFEVPHVITIDAKSSGLCKISYKPVSMSTAVNPHKALFN